jgi:hypothetical protein
VISFATVAVPSAPSTAAGSSIWISKVRVPALRPYRVSSLSHSATIAVTWSGPLTLGSVMVNGSG